MIAWQGREIATIGDTLEAAIDAVMDGREQEFRAAFGSDASLTHALGHLEPQLRGTMMRAFGLG